jgi:2-polyprenyl-3-methyl-5-hydroxy-6-metoxy-1,4-benzoquinol methylase
MLFEDSVSNHNRKCHELSAAQHYRTIFHFARLMLQGNLIDEKHDQYTRVQEYYARVVNDEVCDFMSLQDKRILDVGGLKGAFCRVFSDRFGAGLAVNLDPYLNAYSNLEWDDAVGGQAEWLPFNDNQFDSVMCREVLEHMPTEHLQRLWMKCTE